jgi:hypothetical protein
LTFSHGIPRPKTDIDTGPAGVERATLVIVRRLLLGILVLGLVGTEVELLLLGHYDGFWQVVPLVLMALALLLLAWYGVSRSRASIRALQVMMGVFLLSGGAGVLLHYRGNVEFELERMPSLSGFELFWDAIRGATPTLAPGTMLQLGLVGLAYTYRHPSLRRS